MNKNNKESLDNENDIEDFKSIYYKNEHEDKKAGNIFEGICELVGYFLSK